MGNTITQKEWWRFCGTFCSFFEIFWRKIFRKRRCKVPRKCRHWITPLFKNRDAIFAELSTLFSKYFGEKISEKKREVHYYKVEIFHFWIMTLPNDDVFAELCTFFQMFACKKWNWLAHWQTAIFFSTNKRSFALFCSVLHCSLWCGPAWHDFVWPVETHLKAHHYTRIVQLINYLPLPLCVFYIADFFQPAGKLLQWSMEGY